MDRQETINKVTLVISKACRNAHNAQYQSWEDIVVELADAVGLLLDYRQEEKLVLAKAQTPGSCPRCGKPLQYGKHKIQDRKVLQYCWCGSDKCAWQGYEVHNLVFDKFTSCAGDPVTVRFSDTM